MNIFDQYGIKEVADVTLYSIHRKQDESGELYYVPALHLDTLKISSTEKTAENVWAQGGLGNARLICWDYGKQINITLEDALCSPSSLSMCWGGILGSDWKDGKVEHENIYSTNDYSVDRIDRFEKAFYPKADRETSSISYLLPQTEKDLERTMQDGIICSSKVVDGTNITGFGHVLNHSYKWTMYIESDIKSIAMVPNKFFTGDGRAYKIDDTHQLIVNSTKGATLSGESGCKFNIIYRINPPKTNTIEPVEHLIIDPSGDEVDDYSYPLIASKPNDSTIVNYDYNIAEADDFESFEEGFPISAAEYLCVLIDNDNEYHTYLLKHGLNDKNEEVTLYYERTDIILSQFKGLDMRLKFDNLNELIYYLITKHSDNINYINEGTLQFTKKDEQSVPENGTELLRGDNRKIEGKLWAYVNPRTMCPYSDDYWFSQGEPYYIKSLTLTPKKKKLKAKKITIKAEQFPGMYMIVGETYIRNYDTGEDERMQLKFPLCKVKSNQNLTLEAEGEPTVFTMEVEVARPRTGIMMEMTSYEVETKKDGSTEVLSE